MTEEQKNQVHTAATAGAQQAAAAAKKATGWKKWALIILAILLAGLAVFTQTQCTQVHITPEQLQAAHDVYHAVTGEPCIFVVEDCKK